MSSTDPVADALVLLGRIPTASNATFAGQIGITHVVYKPIAGEQPLWDFPDGTLAAREMAAFEVSQASGWNLVPTTWLRDGPHGPGMVQVWCEPGDESVAVDVVAVDSPQASPRVWHRIVEGLDAQNRAVALVHEESAASRKLAVFDIVINNADRKGGHILAMADGHRFGIDHGLSFHRDHKLRTVLWGWIDEPLTDEEIAGVRAVRTALDLSLGAVLAELITAEEIQACADRCEALISRGTFPPPDDNLPALPYPPL